MAVFTKEEICELFSETNKAISETNKAISETNKGIFELKERQEKTDEQLAKTDAQLAKTDAQLAKTDASLKRLGKRYGGFSNNVGSATEEYFYNVLDENPILNGIRFDHVERNWCKKGHKQNDEFDIVMLTPKASPGDGSAISVIEVKLKADEEDVEKILTTQKKRFNEIFPEYKDYEQHWALATFSIDDKLRKKAVASGLTVLQRKGGIIEHNPPMPCVA